MTQSVTSFETLAINPDRFCEGISKIGYQPSAAIMDIVDNSIAARASRVEIELVMRPDATASTVGGIEAFRIVDDGDGMDDARINVALQIGSDVDYPADSLSKFGFGLKSAGFSLGRRIVVYSRRAGKLSPRKRLDRDVIRERGQYGVLTEELEPGEARRLADRESGTVVQVEVPPPRQDSAAKVRRELLRKLGVTYQCFIDAPDRPLSLSIRIRDKVDAVKGIDILHWEGAAPTFDPEAYDASRPCRLYDTQIVNPAGPDGARIRLQMACFPMDKMKNYPGFDAAQRARIAGYDISRDNTGFFFYRNGRLIRWGDRIAGVGRDDLGFRAKLSFTTEHDELLHVDVSKQNLAIPEAMLESLALAVRVPIGASRQAFALCKQMLDVNQGLEGAEFNKRTEAFEENDASEDVAPPPPEEKRRRRERSERQTREEIAIEEAAAPPAEDETAPEPPQPEEPAPFERVRYSDRIGGLSIALGGYDTDYGTFVRINKNHAFYRLVLSALPAADPYRQSMEALLFAGAVAEMKTVQNLADVNADVIERVLDRFRSVLAQNLELWVSENQDLFG